MLGVRLVITLLCAVGFYASVFMLRKSIRASRGGLDEPSVVQTPRARLFAGLPNALFGSIYYPALALVAWFGAGFALYAGLAAALAAAATSAFLGYSLLFVTRRSCPFCWTAHSVNWLLAVLVIVLTVHR